MSLHASIRLRAGELDLDLALAVETGEVVALLGPNGAGKTTALGALAGLVPFAGRVELDGVVLDDSDSGVHVPTPERPIGYVFQDHLLFPHLSALDNVAFGLRARGVGRAAARDKAAAWLERVGLADRLHDRPRTLSGGEAQRVALARALAVEPRLLLLDEPLSALDASTRTQVRTELRRHLATFEGTRLVVTHDPFEAMVLADRLVILEDGRVIQTGSPAEISRMPRSPYVADLVGLNLLRGVADGDVVRLDSGADFVVADRVLGDVFVTVRPQSVGLFAAPPEGSPRNVWATRVVGLEAAGDRVRVELGAPRPLAAEVTASAVVELGLDVGAEVWAAVKATDVVVYRA